MNYPVNLKHSIAMMVVEMDFETRQEFIKSHKYDKDNSNSFSLNTSNTKNNHQRQRSYYPHYTVDNLYEYCVFRNLVTILNKVFNMPPKNQFVLSHHKSMSEGGEHLKGNLFIQTRHASKSDVNREGETKMTLQEQINYIDGAVKLLGGTVDLSLSSDLNLLMRRLEGVY